MKLSILSYLVTGTVLSLTALATATPSLINYQGRLTDANGDPVTGTKNFTLTIYDAATAGNVLYTENIGAVTLDAKGIYQFQFGDAGISNTEVTETVDTTDGTATTYQKILTNEPVVANSLSVTDGTYTWDQVNGSSDDTKFDAFYSASTQKLTILYMDAAPAAGAEITTTYRYETAGVSGALSGAGEQWLEIGVDGVNQATRQRVLAVPFAENANHAQYAERSGGKIMYDYHIKRIYVLYSDRHEFHDLPGSRHETLYHELPRGFKKLKKLKVETTGYFYQGSQTRMKIVLKKLAFPQNEITVLFEKIGTWAKQEDVVELDLAIDPSFQYELEVTHLSSELHSCTFTVEAHSTE